MLHILLVVPIPNSQIFTNQSLSNVSHHTSFCYLSTDKHYSLCCRMTSATSLQTNPCCTTLVFCLRNVLVHTLKHLASQVTTVKVESVFHSRTNCVSKNIEHEICIALDNTCTGYGHGSRFYTPAPVLALKTCTSWSPALQTSTTLCFVVISDLSFNNGLDSLPQTLSKSAHSIPYLSRPPQAAYVAPKLGSPFLSERILQVCP